MKQTRPRQTGRAYGNDPGGMRYSSLRQIDAVQRGEAACGMDLPHSGCLGRQQWTEAQRPGDDADLVDGTLYLTTAFNRVIALDPVTGDQRWAFDPQIDPSLDYGDGLINRGVATWLDGSQQDASRSAKQPCRRRIYEATLDARLLALDAATGKPCADFGHDGSACCCAMCRDTRAAIEASIRRGGIT